MRTAAFLNSKLCRCVGRGTEGNQRQQSRVLLHDVVQSSLQHNQVLVPWGKIDMAAGRCYEGTNAAKQLIVSVVKQRGHESVGGCKEYGEHNTL